MVEPVPTQQLEFGVEPQRQKNGVDVGFIVVPHFVDIVPKKLGVYGLGCDVQAFRGLFQIGRGQGGLERRNRGSYGRWVEIYFRLGLRV